MKARLRITFTPNEEGWSLHIFAVGPVSLVISFDDRTWNGSYGGHIQIGGGGFTMPGTHVYAKSDWVANEWYIAELLWDSVGDSIKARIYTEGGVVPDWQITWNVPISQLQESAYFSMLSNGGGTTVDRMLQLDYISFLTPDCVDEEGATGIGYVYENFSYSGNSTLTLDNEYVSGSIRVWVGGLLTLNFTEMTSTTIRLDFAPATGAPIRVSYLVQRSENWMIESGFYHGGYIPK
jgi:hypothetical protein